MSEICYGIVIFLIKLYRSAELFVLQLFPPLVEKYVKYHFLRSGIQFNGKHPWDIKVKDNEIYSRIVNHGPLGLGEGYMDEQWEADDVAEMSYRMFEGDAKAVSNWFNPWNRFLNFMACSYFNLQNKTKAWEVGERHYNLGNELFESFLDPSMNYSCGYWKNATNLAQAQTDKMELVARKLCLKPGMRVLDIGCGWGGLSHYLAKNYGVSVVGITISEEQAASARIRVASLPVEIRLQDYRELDETFDRIVSIGMFEHVGRNNHRAFFETVARCLKQDGIFLLHTIGLSHHETPCSEPWLTTYIFPNGYVPYYKQITEEIEELFVIEDWQNFGHDYYKTLVAWLENFKRNWPRIENKYSPRFYRMWLYFFQFGMGGFKARKAHVWQVVLSKDGIKGGYYAGR